jgi:hypothetical protein
MFQLPAADILKFPNIVARVTGPFKMIDALSCSPICGNHEANVQNKCQKSVNSKSWASCGAPFVPCALDFLVVSLEFHSK